LPVFYSPHAYSDDEYGRWNHLTTLEQLMFSRRMFDSAGAGSAFHPHLLPTEGVTVLSPHKGLSGFWSGDLGIQLRQRDIQTLVVAGMAANLCVESHVRDAVENGFDVHVGGDATAGPGRAATEAALVSFALIAASVPSTDEVVEQLALATARAATSHVR
jgi:nicotinamidase-related amidase